MNNDTLSCPYCKFTDDKSNFPDLFTSNDCNTMELQKQYFLLQGMQSVGYNIVTCGMCGDVFIHEC